MDTIAPAALFELSDCELLAQTHVAASHERDATAHHIALLMEVDKRRLYLGEGFSSLFTYCTSALHLSEHAAYGRIEAARAAGKFPLILDLLQRGDITLTTIGLLRPHLTAENYRDVLHRARHQRKHAIEQLVATLHPRPDVPSTVRRLPARTEPPQTSASAPPTSVAEVVTPPPTVARHTTATALAPERYKVQFTIDRITYQQLRRAQDLMRHTVPSGDPATIFARALTLLIADLERTKLAQTEKPRIARSTNTVSRHIPAAVRRAVWQRDGGRCAFQGAQGRCRETGFLEFHHVRPFAEGGLATVENIELRCRAHNAYEGTSISAFRTRCFHGSWKRLRDASAGRTNIQGPRESSLPLTRPDRANSRGTTIAALAAPVVAESDLRPR